MNDRDKNILEAATRVFSRYGVKRASMSDVAEEAGISRQTLYKAFRSKDDILRTHIHVYTDAAIADIEAGLEKTEALAARIDLVLERMIVPGFDMVRASPNAADIVEGVNATTKEELETTAERFQAVIEAVLSPYADALTEAGAPHAVPTPRPGRLAGMSDGVGLALPVQRAQVEGGTRPQRQRFGAKPAKRLRL